ncbi:MAG: hypothetical protein ACRDKI_07825 [Solirubrobacterales bacterium]
MRRLLTLGIVGLIAVLAVPVTSSAIAGGHAQIAKKKKKKKKTYCEKQAKTVKAKLLGKSNGFYVFREKGGGTTLLCQDKPKFYGSMSWNVGDKLGALQVVKKKCALYAAVGSGHNPQIYGINFADFLSHNGQASVYEVGYGATGQLFKVAVSSNCVGVYGTKVDGVPQIVVKGNSAFGYTGTIYPPVGDGITDKELANVKIATTSPTSATVTWTAAGVPKSYLYVKP